MIGRRTGLTLTEVMVVVIIVGILATMALPNFIKAVESTKAKEAVTSLEQIRSGEIIYYGEENTFFYSSGLGGLGETREIRDALMVFLDVRTNRNWDYSVAVRTTPRNTFEATAIRINISPPFGGETITINETGGWGGTWPLPLPVQ